VKTEHKSSNERDMTITGNGSAKGGQYNRVKIMGEGAIDGYLTCNRLRVLGQLTVKGDCTAESFHVLGAFTIDGLLNSGKIEVHLFGPCEVKEIGGGQIHIKRRLLGTAAYKHLTVDTVEGDDIRLEGTRAKVVRGNRVAIGPGCDIDLVEYKDDYHQSPRANVRESKRI